MKKVTVKLSKGISYNVFIGQRVLGKLVPLLKPLKLGRNAIIITNPVIKKIYGKKVINALKKTGINGDFICIPDTEKAKSLKCYADLIREIIRQDKQQDSFIVALGGGVVGDLAGFAAATYKRGIPYIQIPTTLLAQVDSSVGGKTAIDLAVAKNIIGAFYQPSLVLTDVSLLKSLPSSEVKAGLAEIIKYGVIKDKKLFRYTQRNLLKILKKDPKTLQHIVWQSVKIKAEVVGRDELDKKGIRAILNFGHTLGHAIEAASGYSGYVHGEAVAIGMVAASIIGFWMGIFKKEDLAELKKLISDCGLPVCIRRKIRPKDIITAYRHDKKMQKRMNRFILPIAIGKVRVMSNVPEALVRKAIYCRVR